MPDPSPQTPTVEFDRALAQCIERVVLESLANSMLPASQRNVTEGGFSGFCLALAMIAGAPPSSATPFRHIGARRARIELRRAAKAAQAGSPIPDLHATSIEALAAVGWMRGDFRDRPHLAKLAVEAAELWLGASVLSQPEAKPPNLQAKALAGIVAHLFERLTGRPATHTGPYLDVLRAIADVLPSVELGSLEHLAQSVTTQRRLARRSSPKPEG